MPNRNQFHHKVAEDKPHPVTAVKDTKPVVEKVKPLPSSYFPDKKARHEGPNIHR